VLVVMLGALLAVYTMLRAGTVFSTLHGVFRIFVGLLPGWEMPRFAISPDRKHTIPYGVAIMLGSLLAVAVFQPF
jgi:Flp pilus assembly protein protease CpaA